MKHRGNGLGKSPEGTQSDGINKFMLWMKKETSKYEQWEQARPLTESIPSESVTHHGRCQGKCAGCSPHSITLPMTDI